MTIEIPRLDWAGAGRDPDAFAADLGRAFRETGFALLENPAVPRALRAAVLEQAGAFFDRPLAEKAALDIRATPHYRGWAMQGIESLDDASGAVDRKESFNIGLDLAVDDPRVLAGEAFRGVNRWPEMDGFRETMLEYYEAALAQGVALMGMVARDLGLRADHFDDAFRDSLSALRLLHYPPGTGAEGEIGAGAHSDYGALTLLMTDGEGGLQVRPRGGGWMDVPPVEDGYVVNIGDALMRWTNDLYVSTPHRVLPPSRQRRSVAMFVEAAPDAMIEALPGTGAPRHAPIRAADYLRSRLEATYAPKGAA